MVISMAGGTIASRKAKIESAINVRAENGVT